MVPPVAYEKATQRIYNGEREQERETLDSIEYILSWL